MSITDWSGTAGSAAWWAFWMGVLAAFFALMSAVLGGAAFFARQAASRESAERTKQLELRVAEQQERAATAERDLLEIKERQNDRMFTDEHYLSLVNAFSKYTHHPDVQLLYIDEREAKRFAELLADVFQRSGWKTVEVLKWNRAGMLTPGVFIESPKGDVQTNATARFVGQQLVSVGTPALTGEAVEPPLPPNLLLIRVGPRPR